MKRILFTTFAACLLALSAWAAGTKINGIYYNLDSTAKTATVTYTGSYYSSGNNYLGDITIPATVTYGGTTYSVTSIGDWAFYNCKGLTSITIPNSVTTIGSWAFKDCTGLTSITIPNSVTSIESSAFADCTGLTSVTIGNSVTSIGRSAFYNCSGLTSITIPNSVTSIGYYAFKGCTGLTSITIPSSVTSIGGSAFDGCTGLTRVDIKDIAAWCGINFYSSDANPLYYAHHLYLNGKEVTDLTIPSSVTSIGSYAFSGCTDLTSITIPNSVNTIGSSAFSGCTGLTSIKVEEGNTKYDSRDNCDAIIETATNTLIAGSKATTIPNSVISIGSEAFRDCTGLTSVTIPNSVTTIGSSAFYGCSGLTSITIPNSVTAIGNYAFWGCTGLTSITIPNFVTSIGDSAFRGCTGLTSINIPNSVTTIGNRAFLGCTGLTSITLSWDDPTNCTYGSSMLDGVPTSATLYVPAGPKALYENTEPWSSFENIVERGRTEINGIYYNLDSTAKTATVTYTGSYSWSGNNYLGDITIPATVVTYGGTTYSVTSIGSFAFYNCTSLTSITIPNSVTTIGSWAFNGCTSLTSITLRWDDPTNCTYGSSMLDGVPTSATLYVPAGTKALYENTEPWSQFENIEEKESVITLNNTMGTYCDASGLDFSSVEGLEAYTATGYASGEVTLTRVNYVPANTGLVLRGTAGKYEVPKQKVSAYLTNLLKGTTSPITLNQTEGDMTNYILANGSKGIGFYRVASGGGTLAANKAYLQLPSNLSATRPMMLRFEDEDGQTTDIQYLYTSSDDETAPATYDLQGRRVSGTMQQGGIYIVGGKKVIVKSH